MKHTPPPAPSTLDLVDSPALGPVPRGAIALAGIAVILLIAAWLATYFFFFLTRGPVG